MDMDWDQIATVAQLVTGAATLAGYLSPLCSCDCSEKMLIAHLDSVRNFDFGNEELLQDLVLTIVGDESTSELYWKGFRLGLAFASWRYRDLGGFA